MGVGAYLYMDKFKQSIYGLPLPYCLNAIHSFIYCCDGLAFCVPRFLFLSIVLYCFIYTYNETDNIHCDSYVNNNVLLF